MKVEHGKLYAFCTHVGTATLEDGTEIELLHTTKGNMLLQYPDGKTVLFTWTDLLKQVIQKGI